MPFIFGAEFAFINKHDTSAKQTPKQRKSQTSQMLGKIPKRADKQSRTPTRISLSELGCFLFCPPVFGGDSLACNVQLGRPTVPIAIAKSSRVRPCPTWAPLVCTISMQGWKAAYRRRTPCSPLVRPLPIVPNASPPHRPLCGSTKCLHYLALLKIIRCSSCVIKANTIS